MNVLEGNCHVYVDRDADALMARAIVLNSKLRRTGVCGAAETLLIDRAVAPDLVQSLLAALLSAGCEIRAAADLRAMLQDTPLAGRLRSASEQDWYTEYLDAIIAVRLVDGVDGARACEIAGLVAFLDSLSP